MTRTSKPLRPTRVRVARRPDGEPGPWCEWLETTGYGDDLALLVAVPQDDGGTRLARWPVIGIAIEIEDGPTFELRTPDHDH